MAGIIRETNTTSGLQLGIVISQHPGKPDILVHYDVIANLRQELTGDGGDVAVGDRHLQLPRIDHFDDLARVDQTGQPLYLDGGSFLFAQPLVQFFQTELVARPFPDMNFAAAQVLDSCNPINRPAGDQDLLEAP